MSDYIDDIIEEQEERFDIVENPNPDLISYDDLITKFEYQFRFSPDVGQDKTDYVKYFFTNVLGLAQKDFPDNYMNTVNEENQRMYYDFMRIFAYNMRYTFGITVDENNDYYFEILYNLYYFLVVNPESFVVDYMLYYHLYKEGYNINEYFKKEKINSKLELNDIFSENPVNAINSQLDLYYKQRKENEKQDIEIGNITYQDRFDLFVKYANDIFTNPNEFNMYDTFHKLNEMNPCDNYEMLDEKITMENAIMFESDELISEQILKRNFDVAHLEDYINKSLIDPFFKYIANFDYMIKSAINYYI